MVVTLWEGRYGNLCIVDVKCLIRIARNGFSTYTAAEGIGGLSVTTVFEDAAGVLFAVTNQASTVGIHQFDGQQFIPTRPRYPPRIRYFGWGFNQSALQDHSGE